VVGDDLPAYHRTILEGLKGVDLGGLETRNGGKTFAWGGKYLLNLNERETLFTELGVVADAPPQVPASFADSELVFLGNTHPAVQAGLLPGPALGAPWPAHAAAPTVARAPNAEGRVRDAGSRGEIPAETRCVWTQGIELDDSTGLLPSAHGEGRLVADDALLDALEANGQVAVRYHAADHFNGSMRRIAGICDPSGLVFGLMPHPERYIRWTQHPRWTRLTPHQRHGEPLGLRMFRNAVERVLVNA
jgi:phosphoribosylformylglycinamidine synthase